MSKATIACVLAFVSLCAHAAQDADFIVARNAFQSGDRARLARIAPALEGYVLESYVDYWQLKLDLDRVSPDEVRAFLKRYDGTVVADRLRADWLKALGARSSWDLFREQYPLLAAPDTETVCYSAQARMAVGDLSGLAEVKPLWLSGREQPPSCSPLFEAMLTGGQITTPDVWARMRLALESGQVGLAKKLAAYLPPADSPDPTALDAAAENPRRFLDKRTPGGTNRSTREVIIFALYRLAKSSPQQARDEWIKIRRRSRRRTSGTLPGNSPIRPRSGRIPRHWRGTVNRAPGDRTTSSSAGTYAPRCGCRPGKMSSPPRKRCR